MFEFSNMKFVSCGKFFILLGFQGVWAWTVQTFLRLLDTDKEIDLDRQVKYV